MPPRDGADNGTMQGNLPEPYPPRPENIGFQVSLLRLLYSRADATPPVSELEGLLKPPANPPPAN
jgi:hypothetical protein